MFWDPATRLPMRATLNFLEGTPQWQGSAGVWQFHLQLPVTATKLPPVGSLVTLFGRRGTTWQATNSTHVLAVCTLPPFRPAHLFGWSWSSVQQWVCSLAAGFHRQSPGRVGIPVG